MTRRTSGTPLTGMAALARTEVSGRRRVPRPAARIRARNARSIAGRGPEERRFGPEDHVGRCEAVRVAVLQEQAAIGVEDVVVGRAAERRGRVLDPLLAALDFD